MTLHTTSVLLDLISLDFYSALEPYKIPDLDSLTEKVHIYEVVR